MTRRRGSRDALEECSPHSSRQIKHCRVVVASGCDDEAVAPRWSAETQTKLEAVFDNGGLDGVPTTL